MCYLCEEQCETDVDLLSHWVFSGATVFRPITSLKLTTRARNVLSKMGTITIEDLLRLSAGEVWIQPNCGRKTVRDIKDAMAIIGEKWPVVSHRNDQFIDRC